MAWSRLVQVSEMQFDSDVSAPVLSPSDRLQLRHAPHLVSDTIYSSAAFTMDVLSSVHVHVYVVAEVGSRRQAFNSRNEEGFADPHFST